MKAPSTYQNIFIAEGVLNLTLEFNLVYSNITFLCI